MTKATRQTISSITTIGIFILTIYIPSIITIFAPKPDVSITEKRKLAALPELKMNKQALEGFPSGFEAYFNDHFGFRDILIRWNNWISIKWLKKSPVFVILKGKKEWLFTTRHESINDYRGLIQLNPLTLKTWQEDLEWKNNWLAEQGIRYLFVAVPSKQTIYPEYMPDYLNKVNTKTRLDQLVEYLHHHSDVPFLDLRTPLLKAKETGLVYYPLDNHLNHKGAFIGYKNIMNMISKWFMEEKIRDYLSFNNYEIKYIKAGMADGLGFSSPQSSAVEALVEAYTPAFQLNSPCSKKLSLIIEDANLSPRTKMTQTFVKDCINSKLRAIIVRDSMFIELEPFLSEHFKRVAYVWMTSTWKAYDHALLKQLIWLIQPDIIIEEKAERLLFRDISH